MTQFASHFFIFNFISTHILTKRMTISDIVLSPSISFQLTSSRRGWQSSLNISLNLSNISTHILTKRMTTLWTTYININIHFNSHPHEEDDGFYVDLHRLHSSFQLTSSRRGWLKETCQHPYSCNISTHILTKRMTRRLHTICYNDCISTHILTKRMTFSSNTSNIRRAFQLTSSRRGWLATNVPITATTPISTHILTKRMTLL